MAPLFCPNFYINIRAKQVHTFISTSGISLFGSISRNFKSYFGVIQYHMNFSKGKGIAYNRRFSQIDPEEITAKKLENLLEEKIKYTSTEDITLPSTEKYAFGIEEDAVITIKYVQKFPHHTFSIYPIRPNWI